MPRSSPEPLVLAALLLAGALLLGAAPARAAEDVQARARSILSDPRYQVALPDHTPAGELDEPSRQGPALSGRSPSVALPVLGAGAALARIVFLVLLVVAVLLIAFWISKLVTDRSREGREAPGAGDQAPAAGGAPPEPQFEDASRLAAEGRYAEAIHALLLASIRYFAERSRMRVEPSRTSRELIRLLPLNPEAREAFTDLVRRVELSLFGGLPVGPEDYEQSLARFRALTRRAA